MYADYTPPSYFSVVTTTSGTSKMLEIDISKVEAQVDFYVKATSFGGVIAQGA